MRRRWREVGRWTAAAVVAVAWFGCGPSPEAKIRGWPLSDAERIAMWPPQDVGDDGDEPDAGGAAPSDGVESDAVPAVAAVPADAGPCAGLVAMACELYGDFNDGCQEARSKPPDDRHPQTREVCAELVKRFTEVELPRVGGACYRYTRALCALHGEGSERCRTARATVQLARSRREHRICLGDWLLLETRTLRR
jgi:hypothetical protein